jgi:hypothetical protein
VQTRETRFADCPDRVNGMTGLQCPRSVPGTGATLRHEWGSPPELAHRAISGTPARFDCAISGSMGGPSSLRRRPFDHLSVAILGGVDFLLSQA